MNGPSDDLIVSARKLVKEYSKQRVVNEVSFDIPAGCCFGFLGPNGAGKTTSLRMLLGLTEPTSGELTVFGLPVPERARQVRARVGVVPQADNLDPDFTVAENLLMYGRYFGLPKSTVEARIPPLLEFAALTERRDSKTDALSGGMQRRLTIARALVNDPDLLVLDEPTTGLDPQARHVIWSRLNDLRERGMTLILTTHYMEEAERLCDRLVIMDHGRILDEGSPRQLITRHVEREVVEIRGGVGGKMPDIPVGQNCRLEQMGSSLYCYTQEPTPLLSRLRQIPGLNFLHRPSGLEDVFLKLTGRELRD